MESMKYITTVFLLFSIAVFSAVPNPLSDTKEEIQKIKSNLTEKTQHSLKLQAQIRSLENNLETQNKNHLKVLNEINELEDTLSQMRLSLTEQASLIAQKEKKLRAWISELALTQNNTLEFTIKKRLANKEVDKLKVELDKLKRQNEFLSSKLDLYQQKADKLKIQEETLLSLISDLEDDKQDLAKNYLSTQAEKTELENILTQKKVVLINKKKSLKSKAKDLFSHPLAAFDKVKKGSKGVTYFFRGEKPILASASGKVIYTGELSTYGQVIMLDHGNGMKSVMLGNLAPKVNKGDQVSKGELLAYTRGNSLKKNKLYFELRKANKAQNTFKWLQ